MTILCFGVYIVNESMILIFSFLHETQALWQNSFLGKSCCYHSKIWYQTSELLCSLDKQKSFTVWSNDILALSQTPEPVCYLDQQNTFTGWTNDTPALSQTPELVCSVDKQNTFTAGLMTLLLSPKHMN
jgi:hypothetical protein